MKWIRTVVAAVLAVLLIGCGSDTSPIVRNLANGAWSETLVDSSGQLGSFVFNMTQNGTELTGSNMDFSNMGSLYHCFGTGTTMKGQMAVGMMDGGTMNISMSGAPSEGTQPNILSMHGIMTMGMVSGTGSFTLSANTPGCPSKTGTFTMTHTSPTPRDHLI